MNLAATLAEINALPVTDRIRMADAIWEGIENQWENDEAVAVELSDEQRAELDRRIADAEAQPDDHCTWEELKAAARRDVRK